ARPLPPCEIRHRRLPGRLDRLGEFWRRRISGWAKGEPRLVRGRGGRRPCEGPEDRLRNGLRPASTRFNLESRGPRTGPSVLAAEQPVPLEARLLEPRGAIERLHYKGVVVDGRAVLVSSMNWALGSATENREISVLLEDSEIARRFQDAFDADWEGRPTSGFD